MGEKGGSNWMAFRNAVTRSGSALDSSSSGSSHFSPLKMYHEYPTHAKECMRSVRK